MLKKGSVPVPYIIALILGVAVVGVFVYWIYVSGGSIGSAQCTAIRVRYCEAWYVKSKFDITNRPTGIWDSSCGAEPEDKECEVVLGIS